MINTSRKLKALSDAATQGELSVSSGEMCTISDSKGRIANMCFLNLTGRRNEEETVDTAHFLAALVNAYRSGQLVHVDEVEKLREALDRAAFVLATMPDIALRVGLQGKSQWDEIAGGVDLFGALDAARAALGDSQ